jgi:hypothetical protein
MKTTDLGHSAWGARLFQRLATLPKTQISETALRAPLPPTCHRDHHCPARQLKASSTHGPSAPSRQHLTLHTSTSAANGLTRSPPTLPLVETRLCKRRPQGGRDADGAAIAVQQTGPGFHPETPCFRTRCPIVMSPVGRTTPQAAATTTTGTSTSEDFRPGQHRATRTISIKQQQNKLLPPPLLH